MNNEKTKELCLNIMKSDTEDEVVKLLQEACLWDDPSAWRFYGDIENNYSTIGNQQSRPEAALVEKIVNAVDARLINACLENGINPESSDDAPANIHDAVCKLFNGNSGHLGYWAKLTRQNEAKFITLAATGSNKNTCITIVDQGEGQMPSQIPYTFMSLNRSNKLKIPFVQGRFNMGGTGVLKFCGKHRFQLLITKRNPKILTDDERCDPTSQNWGFTITRRQKPEGAVRNSVFMYLAPENNEVLQFSAKSLCLIPEYNEPYREELKYGSMIKLFSYDMKGFTSHILLPDGLLNRLETLLPEIALPVNLHECRAFKGKKKGSFVTPLSGLTVRLEDGKGGNLEEGYPDSTPFEVRGEKMVAKIYAFKKGKAENYRTNEGVIFSINGQTHGILPKTIFGRNKVKHGRLQSSLIVTVDCTEISHDAREDLFMNSRDRLSNTQLRKDIEREIEDILRQHTGLKELSNRRKEQEVGDRLADSKPLEEILNSIFKTSPSLRSLLPTGQRLNNPFNKEAGNKDNSGSNGRGGKEGKGPGNDTFIGKPHPTFFRFYKKHDNEPVSRNFEIGRRCRLKLETDVVNEYFKRAENHGEYEVKIIEDGTGKYKDEYVQSNLNLHNGMANWSLLLPDSMEIGNNITLELKINDETLLEPFVNIAKLSTTPKSDPEDTPGGTRKSSSSGGKGQQEEHLAMPRVIEVKEEDWSNHDFNENSALKVIQETDNSYTFYLNIDNIYLLHEMKNSKEPVLVKAQFEYGNVLIGLAILQEYKGRHDNNSDESDHSVEEKIRAFSKAVAPFMVPMIQSLGGLTEEDVSNAGMIGDED